MDPLTKLLIKQTAKSAAIWYAVSIGVVVFVWLVRVLAWKMYGDHPNG
jgi:hypothetical protein